MHSLSISWSDGVSDPEAAAAIQTIEEMFEQVADLWPARSSLARVPEIRPFGNWVLQGAEPHQPYNSIEWYVRRSLNAERGALDGMRWLETVLHEPWQQQSPHFDLGIVHHPLLDGEGREVFGLFMLGRIAVVSLHPTRALVSDEQRMAVLRRQVAHFSGRMFGLPHFRRRSAAGGCTNLCALRVATSLKEWVDLTQEEMLAQRIYCDDCRRELAARFASAHFGLN